MPHLGQNLTLIQPPPQPPIQLDHPSHQEQPQPPHLLNLQPQHQPPPPQVPRLRSPPPPPPPPLLVQPQRQETAHPTPQA